MKNPLRRRSNFTDSKIFSGDHLPDEALIRLLDGELSSSQADKVNAHVLSCWACRSRRQAIEDAILEFVDHQNTVAAAYLPPSSEGRVLFLARLNALAAELERPSLLKRCFDRAIHPVGIVAKSRVVHIAAVLVLVAMCLIAYLIRPLHVVSADEILNRAIALENTSLQGTSRPVVVQKIRIRVGGHSMTRTIYRDMTHRRTASQMDDALAGRDAAKAAYLKSALDWDSPLDAETYRRWCNEHAKGGARVVQRDSNRITLKTKLSSGVVTEADLTLRADDYHAIEENFRFEDQSELEIAELSYEVVPFSSLPKQIFELRLASSAPRLPSIVKMRPMLPTSAELAQTEVQAETILHKLGGDLGEQINIAVTATHGVVIDGVVADDMRRKELASALQGLAYTTVKLSTVAEMAQRTASASSIHATPAAVQVIPAAPPLLDSELDAHFPDKEQRDTYVNQTLSMAQIASARGWALNRLVDRHPAASLALLDDSSRRELQELLIDHVSVLREDIGSLQKQLSQILSKSSDTLAANTAIPISDAGSTAQADEDWQERVRRVHSSIEAIHEAVATLLTSSPPDSGNNAETIEVNLRTSLTQVQAELQALDEELHKEVLK